jgi:hypothetical protein
MLADNKVTRSFCSTGISLHWGISNLIVLTIIVAMVGTTQFALAKVQPPFHCWTCCPDPPNCNADLPNWRISIKDHVAIGNILVAGQKPTSTQLKAAAQAITTWSEGDGMNTFFSQIDTGVKAIGQDYFVNTAVDGKQIYAGVAAFGNQITVADFDTMMSRVTAANRLALYTELATYGSEQLVWHYAEYLNQLADALERGIKPPVRPAFFFGTLIVMGAVLALIGATGGGAGFVLLGIMVGMGGSIGNWVAGLGPERRPENASSMAVGIYDLTATRTWSLAHL